MTPRDGNDRYLINTYVWLRLKGFNPIKTHCSCAYDLMVNDKRVEVKECRPTTKPHKGNDGISRRYTEWQANIHRHGKVNESSCDVYIVRLVGIPEFSSAVYLILPAPLKKPTLRISL